MTDRRARFTMFFRLFFSLPISLGAIKVAVVVGTALNAINQGGALLGQGRTHWGNVALNFVVPFCVAAYSAARNQLQLTRSSLNEPGPAGPPRRGLVKPGGKDPRPADGVEPSPRAGSNLAGRAHDSHLIRSPRERPKQPCRSRQHAQ